MCLKVNIANSRWQWICLRIPNQSNSVRRTHSEYLWRSGRNSGTGHSASPVGLGNQPHATSLQRDAVWERELLTERWNRLSGDLRVCLCTRLCIWVTKPDVQNFIPTQHSAGKLPKGWNDFRLRRSEWRISVDRNERKSCHCQGNHCLSTARCRHGHRTL